MNDVQGGGIDIGSVGGNLSFQAGGDIVAGNKTIINNIIQRLAKELTTTPYKFLASYDIADRDIFYGRDTIIEELAAQIGRHKVILINGASGAGKSSLVNAGLIPRVADNGYTFVAFREYSDPLAQLQAYFDTAHGLPAKPGDGQGSLLQLIRGFGAFPMVIFLDQFERFFVRVAEDKRCAFIAAFNHCLMHSEAKDLCFVLAFRREFLGQLTSEFEEQIPGFLSEAYRINLLPLSKAEAREAVLQPVAKTSLKIQYDEDFVDNVLLAGLAEQTGGGMSIDPPHLQIVCNQLFEAARQHLQTRSSVLINRVLYDELGGAQNILNTYLDKVVEDVAQNPEQITVVHSILKTMVDTGSNTRAFVAMADFHRALPDVNEAEILKFIEKLLERRVIEERKPAYSLSHEQMVGKVKEWFDPRELERKRAEETLNRGMMEWKNSGAVLNRGQVERIREWITAPGAEEQILLQESEADYLKKEREESERERQLLASKRTRRRAIQIGFGVAMVLTVIASVFAWNFREQTNLAREERDKVRIQLLAMQARRAVSNANTSDDIGRGAALAVQSIALARKGNRTAEADALEAAGSALSRLPLQALRGGGRLIDGMDVPRTGLGGIPSSALRGGGSMLAVLADGRLVSGGVDGKIRLWPKDGTGQPMVLLHGSPVQSLAVLADGRLASGGSGSDGKIKLWPKDGNGEPVALLHGSPVLSLAVLADGRLASGGEDGKIKLWPKDGTGEPVVMVGGGYGGVRALAVLADGRLASGGYDGTIRLWPENGTGEPVVLWNGKSIFQAVASLAVLADGRLASGGSWNGQIKLWPENGTGEPAVLTHGATVNSLAVLADGRLASGGDDGTIRLWPENGTGEPVVLWHGGRASRVVSLAVLADGRLASAGRDGEIKLWPKDGTGEPVVLTQGGGFASLAVLADGRLASGGKDGKITLWPKDGTGEPLVLTHPPYGPESLLDGAHHVLSLAVLADGRLASGGSDGKIKLWPKDGTGEPVALLHDSRVQALAVLADGRLASGGSGGEIKLWPKDGTGEPVPLTHGNSVVALAALPDGRLASGGSDGKIKLWSKDGTGGPVILIHGGGSVASLAVLADGRLASGGDDGQIKLWPKDGNGKPMVLPNGGAVRSLAALADGRLASGDLDGKIRLWAKDGTGDPVTLIHGNSVVALAALADGRLASGDDDGKIRLWLVQEEKLVAALCLHAGRDLSRDEWVRYIGSDTPREPSCGNRASNWWTPD